MDVAVRIEPVSVLPGDVITGTVSLYRSTFAELPFQTPLERHLTAARAPTNPPASLAPFHVSVSLIGRARVNLSHNYVVFQSERIQIVTSSQLAFQIKLPTNQSSHQSLLPSHHRGVALRCVYFIEVMIGHNPEQTIKKFRVPVTVRSSTSSFATPIPSHPIESEWVRLVSHQSSLTTTSRPKSPCTPHKHVRSDSMMEEQLAMLEARLRAEFDGRGLKQPGDDWHVVVTEDSHDTHILMQGAPSKEHVTSSRSFDIEYLGSSVCILWLAQDRFELGEVVRGLFLFGDGTTSCLFSRVRIVSRDFDLDEDAAQRSNTIAGEYNTVCAGIVSTEFALPLPVGPDACANFESDTVYLQWFLEFVFVLNNTTSTMDPKDLSKGVREDSFTGEFLERLANGDVTSDKLDVLQWELPLVVHPQSTAASSRSANTKVFFIQLNELSNK